MTQLVMLNDVADTHKLVADYCRRKQPSTDGEYYANKGEIIRATGMDDKSFRRYVKEAVDIGLLTRCGRWYRVNMPLGSEFSGPTSPRYRVDFSRIQTSKFQAAPTDRLRGVKMDAVHIDEMTSYDMDIRKIFNDMMMKDILDDDD